jgi:hypothetical protein
MMHRQICNTDISANAYVRISWPYDYRCSMQIIRLASYAGTPVECVVAPEDIFMNKMAHRPFRFLIVQQETVVLMKLRLC